MNRYFPVFVLLVFLAVALTSTACVYESEHLKDLKCSPNGKRQGDALCIDGLWIYDPVDGSILSDAGNIPDEDGSADVVEPPLDSDVDLQDTGADATDDTSPEDSGDPDTEQLDTDIPDVEEPDVEDPDTGEPIGNSCTVHEDCITEYCEDGICTVNLCTNGVRDAGEVDIDCGGTCAQQCSGYKQVAAGGRHTCAIRADDSVACWGHGNQLIGVPEANQKFKSLSAGDRFVCGILLHPPAASDLNQSNVRCWGKPDESHTNIFTKIPAVALEQITAGGEHVCGISEVAQNLHCWGNDGKHRTNPSNSDAANAPVGQRVNDYHWKQVHAGTEHNCAVAEEAGIFRCWGNYEDKRRDFGNRAGKPAFQHMVAGSKHTCAIDVDDVITCYSNKPGDDIRKNIPTAIFKEIDSRTDYACIIKDSDDSISCWGHNRAGRVGNAPKTGAYTQISTGWEHACALRSSDGSIQCWGNTADARYPAEFAVP